MSIASVDLIFLGNIEFVDSGKIRQFLSEYFDDFTFLTGSPHDLSDSLIDFLMLFNILIDEGNQFDSKDFLLSDIFCFE